MTNEEMNEQIEKWKELIAQTKGFLEAKGDSISDRAILRINALLDAAEENEKLTEKLKRAIESNQATINAIIIAASALPQAQGFPIDEIGVSIKNHNQVLHVFFKKTQEVNGEFWRYKSHKIESL